MKIRKVLFAPGKSAFFFDDQRAIKNGAVHDGFVYVGEPATEGFRRIREAGESISVLLVLDDGSVAAGDCAAVQYSGAGGRDPLFKAQSYIPLLERELRPALEGTEVKPFREMVKDLSFLEAGPRRLHTAARYGLSQALLDARALATGRMKCEVICEEYGLPVVAERVPVFGQTGDNRYENVDKMILKETEVIPHGLINNIGEKLGRDGQKLKEYIAWLAGRVKKLRTRADYLPDLHIDVYGTIGLIFDMDLKKVAEYLKSLEPFAGEHLLYIEGPVDMEGKPAQIEALGVIRGLLDASGCGVKIVADEWCNTYEDIVEFTDAECCHMVQIKTPDLGGIQNTVESVLYCRAHGMEAYQGGTCNETDLSARTCVHLAMATRPERMLAKPGMGFDEGFTVVNNEMERIIAVLRSRT
jgi:methylaspartate ammonia-lyase